MTERSLSLLAARDVRVDLEGAVVLEHVTFETRGQRVAVAGDGYAVLAALAGVASVRAGALTLLDRDVAKGEHLPHVGFAPLDPPLAPRWTVTRFLTWSARLAGLGRRDAAAAAATTLSDLDLSSLSYARLGALRLEERRAVVLAQAVVASPSVLLAGAPLASLAPPLAQYVANVLALAEKGRRSVVSLSPGASWLHPGSPEHGLASRADDLLVFAAGALARQGKLAALEQATTAYLMTVRAPAAELIAELSARGARFEGGPSRFWVDLPEEIRAHDVLVVAHRVGVPVVELSPHLPSGPQSVLREEPARHE